MIEKTIEWYKGKSKFWKVVLFVFVGLFIVGIFAYQFLSMRTIPSSIFVKQSKEKTDRQVMNYEVLAYEEAKKRDKLQKEIDDIEKQKGEVINENRKIIEMLDRNCSDDDLKRIEAELRRRDKA